MPTPRYILELRETWGHRPLLLPGVSGVVFDGDRVLLVRRADNGRWSVPAGILEPGEQPADCIAREIWEEARVVAQPQRLALLSADPEISYPNGDRCQFLSMTFRCGYVSGEPAVGDEESTDVGWFGPDELPADLTPRSRRRIALAAPAQGECVFDTLDPRLPDHSR